MPVHVPEHLVPDAAVPGRPRVRKSPRWELYADGLWWMIDMAADAPLMTMEGLRASAGAWARRNAAVADVRVRPGAHDKVFVRLIPQYS